MSFNSFNRLSYDTCEQKTDINQSVKAADYGINTPVTCNGCFQMNPSVIQQKGGVSLQKDTPWRFYDGPVDVESDLKNITRPATNCPDFKFKPTCNEGCLNQGHPCGQGVVRGCSNSDSIDKLGVMANENLVDFNDCLFPVENTRLTNPPCTLRGTGINRFNPLCLDPQKNIFFPGSYQVPTRIVVKDNHK